MYVQFFPTTNVPKTSQDKDLLLQKKSKEVEEFGLRMSDIDFADGMKHFDDTLRGESEGKFRST